MVVVVVMVVVMVVEICWSYADKLSRNANQFVLRKMVIYEE
jgi:hypothetical protein